MRSFVTAAILTLTLFFHPLVNGQQADNTGRSVYTNDDIGVKIPFAKDWLIITKREQAPATIKPYFPENKGKDDSPLFIGLSRKQQLYMRLLVEPFYGSLNTYVKLLTATLEKQGVRILAARITPEKDAAEIDYLQQQLGFEFRERLAITQGRYILRMGFWGLHSQLPGYTGTINGLFDQAELLEAGDGNPEWQKPWAGLEQRLPAENLAGVNITHLAAATEQPLQCRDPAGTLLWKIKGKHSTVYLFGSIHVGKADFYPLPAVIEAAFHDAQHIVFEVDPRSLNDPSVVADIQAQGVLPEGKTLNDLISKPVMDNLITTLSGMGLSAANFMQYKPWFLTMLLSNLQMASLGYLPDQGIELHLIKERSPQSQVLELESLQQQIGLFKKLNGETFLAYTLLDYNEGREKIPQMINAWRCADRKALKDILFSDLEEASARDPEMKKLVDLLFFERDKKMAHTITGYLEKGKGEYFVVVGAGHLIGKGSIVDILDDRYKVVNVRL